MNMDSDGYAENSIFQQTLIITISKTEKMTIENVRESLWIQLRIYIMTTTGLSVTGEWSSFWNGKEST